MAAQAELAKKKTLGEGQIHNGTDYRLRRPSLVVGRSPVVSEFRESPGDFRKAVFSAHRNGNFPYLLRTPKT